MFTKNTPLRLTYRFQVETFVQEVLYQGSVGLIVFAEALQLLLSIASPFPLGNQFAHLAVEDFVNATHWRHLQRTSGSKRVKYKNEFDSVTDERKWN